jgi:hypothetical protein
MNNVKGGGSKRKTRETLAIIGRDKERKIKWKRGGKYSWNLREKP